MIKNSSIKPSDLSHTRRIFLAFDLPRPIIEELRRYYDKSAPVRWTKPENLHVTLVFLGDVVGDEALESVMKIVERVSARARPVLVKLLSIDAYRSMIWSTVEPNRQMQELRDKLVQAFNVAHVGSGESGQRSFRPHVNLARGAAQITQSYKTAVKLPDLYFTATHVVVFESHLKSEGPTYVSLDSFELGAR